MHSESSWEFVTLPECFGWPAERKSMAGKHVYVWQASQITARGAWCYRLEDGPVVCLSDRANKGVTKSAAAAALRRSVREILIGRL